VGFFSYFLLLCDAEMSSNQAVSSHPSNEFIWHYHIYIIALSNLCLRWKGKVSRGNGE